MFADIARCCNNTGAGAAVADCELLGPLQVPCCLPRVQLWVASVCATHKHARTCTAMVVVSAKLQQHHRGLLSLQVLSDGCVGVMHAVVLGGLLLVSSSALQAGQWAGCPSVASMHH
jgi:hypothetical protein